MTLKSLLDQIEAQARAAREALDDEAEGRLRAALELLLADAEAAHHLVRTW